MAYTDSATFTAGIEWNGVWLHDPVNADDTARLYLYGGPSRSASIAVAAEGRAYAGRVYPVYDYGDHQEDHFPVGIDVPFSDTWEAELAVLRGFAAHRQALVFRDNRGRVVQGAMTGYSEEDTTSGTAVSFTFVRTDTDTVLVTV